MSDVGITWHGLSSVSEHHCRVMTGQTYPSCQSLGSGEAADQYYVPVNKTWRLNERMYGGLTGREWRLHGKPHSVRR